MAQEMEMYNDGNEYPKTVKQQNTDSEKSKAKKILAKMDSEYS